MERSFPNQANCHFRSFPQPSNINVFKETCLNGGSTRSDAFVAAQNHHPLNSPVE
jgi:hypothetical protein